MKKEKELTKEIDNTSVREANESKEPKEPKWDDGHEKFGEVYFG